VRILIVEDNSDKRKAIRRVLDDFLKSRDIHSDVVENESFQEAVSSIESIAFDFIIFDLLLPGRTGDSELSDFSSEIPELLRESELNRTSSVIAITEYGKIRDDCWNAFQLLSIHVLEYEMDNSDWEVGLKSFLVTASNKPHFDFVIVAALEKEAQAYQNIEGFETLPRERAHGVTLKRCTFRGLKGAIVKLPEMGPVASAAVVAQCLTKFHCKFYAMSGICAGIPKNVNLGDVIIADIAFDYQAGKIDKTGKHLLSKVTAKALGPDIHHLQGLLDTTDVDKEMRDNPLFDEAFQKGTTKVGAVASGSAVINYEDFRKDIEGQGRDVCGIDMEIFAFYRAIELSGQVCRFIAIKAVVDLADGEKNDKLQAHGSILSAKLTAWGIENLLTG